MWQMARAMPPTGHSTHFKLFYFSFQADIKRICTKLDRYLELFISPGPWWLKASLQIKKTNVSSPWEWCSSKDAQCCFCTKYVRQIAPTLTHFSLVLRPDYFLGVGCGEGEILWKGAKTTQGCVHFLYPLYFVNKRGPEQTVNIRNNCVQSVLSSCFIFQKL